MRPAPSDIADPGESPLSTREQREHLRRLRIRLAALQRHRAARDPATGKSALAVSGGKASAKQREGDRAWGLDLAINRWHGTKEER